MATQFANGKTTTSGLVFMYDTVDKENCYKGEPTVNLLYSPGATNLLNGAGDIYGRCTKTDLGNGKYRFVNNGTGATTVRVYTNQPDLINGATYACSVYFENLIGSISIDWCDTGITGVNYSTDASGRLGGYGSRASYASPYYFLDINLDSGGAATIFNPQVEFNTHVTPFVAGTRSSTQGLLDLTNTTTIDISPVSFDANAQMTFDGSNDYSIVSTINPDFSAGITMECVAKYTSSSGQWQHMLDFGRGSGNYNLLLGRYGTADQLFFAIFVGGSAQLIIANQSSFKFGQHAVYTATADGTDFKLYVNGQLITSTANSTKPSNIPRFTNYIGRSTLFGTYFNGEIPIAKIYNRALTQSEITQNYTSYKTRFNLA